MKKFIGFVILMMAFATISSSLSSCGGIGEDGEWHSWDEIDEYTMLSSLETTMDIDDLINNTPGAQDTVNAINTLLTRYKFSKYFAYQAQATKMYDSLVADAQIKVLPHLNNLAAKIGNKDFEVWMRYRQGGSNTVSSYIDPQTHLKPTIDLSDYKYYYTKADVCPGYNMISDDLAYTLYTTYSNKRIFFTSTEAAKAAFTTFFNKVKAEQQAALDARKKNTDYIIVQYLQGGYVYGSVAYTDTIRPTGYMK